MSWLDAGSRIRVKSFPRFTSLSLAGGGALFVLAALVPEAVQPVFCIVYALLASASSVSPASAPKGNADAPPAGSCKNTWEFTWEIEPSLVAFGIVFGLTFVYLFNSGQQDVLVGLLFVIPGAGLIAALALSGGPWASPSSNGCCCASPCWRACPCPSPPRPSSWPARAWSWPLGRRSSR
ncbi:MAG: hypothetical protein V8S24_00605 [Gordonibacter pamelaeae]